MVGAVAAVTIASCLLLVLARRFGTIWLGALALIAPAAIAAKVTVPQAWRTARLESRLTEAQAQTWLPGALAVTRNLPLIRAAQDHIPTEGTYAWVPAGPFRHFGPTEWHNRYVALTGWAQYALAPRVAVKPAAARWLLVLDDSPRAAGLKHWRLALRYGNDWLVER
jgi:hypothetical protein